MIRMVKFIILGVLIHLVQLPAYAQYTTTYPENLDRFEDEIIEIEDRITVLDHSRPVVLFLGSSSVRMWNTLEEDMDPIQVINAGFGGATMPEIFHYLDRIVLPVRPDYIVYYCGENDIADFGANPEDIMHNFSMLLGVLWFHFPDLPIFFVSIKPSPSRWVDWPEMEEANDLMKNYHKDTFIDISQPMLGEDGRVRNDIFIEDDLHMNKEGYSLWTEIIKDYLFDKMK